MFVDDIKIFTKVRSAHDQTILQRSLDNISAWCMVNTIHLNVAKCHVIVFRMGATCLDDNYNIRDGNPLEAVNKVKDLSILVTQSLSPFKHLIHITSRTAVLIRFIFRSTRGFRDPI